MEKIGVIGLGRMGAAIAKRMHDQGHQVATWTRSGRAVAGIATAPDIATLIATSDTLVLSLLNDNAVAEVLDACMACDLDGKQIIETSTVVPTLLQARIARIAARGGSAVAAGIAISVALMICWHLRYAQAFRWKQRSASFVADLQVCRW